MYFYKGLWFRQDFYIYLYLHTFQVKNFIHDYVATLRYGAACKLERKRCRSKEEPRLKNDEEENSVKEDRTHQIAVWRSNSSNTKQIEAIARPEAKSDRKSKPSLVLRPNPIENRVIRRRLKLLIHSRPVYTRPEAARPRSRPKNFVKLTPETKKVSQIDRLRTGYALGNEEKVRQRHLEEATHHSSLQASLLLVKSIVCWRKFVKKFAG